MQTVLITGSKGLCGINLCDYFTVKNYRVIRIDRSKEFKMNAIQHDLQYPIPPAKIPYPVDYIIHLAATIDEVGKYPYQMVKNNILVTYNILEFAKLYKVKKIIYASSSALNRQPLTPYGFSKYIGEYMVGIYRKQYAVPSISFRLGYILGSPLPKRYFIYRLAKRMKKNLPITLTNADGKISFIDIHDTARFFEKALRNNLNGTYELTGQRTTINDVIQVLLKFYPDYKKPLSFEKNKQKNYMYNSSKKTFKDFQMTFKYSFEDIMQKVYDAKGLP